MFLKVEKLFGFSTYIFCFWRTNKNKNIFFSFDLYPNQIWYILFQLLSDWKECFIFPVGIKQLTMIDTKRHMRKCENLIK